MQLSRSTRRTGKLSMIGIIHHKRAPRKLAVIATIMQRCRARRSCHDRQIRLMHSTAILCHLYGSMEKRAGISVPFAPA